MQNSVIDQARSKNSLAIITRGPAEGRPRTVRELQCAQQRFWTALAARTTERLNDSMVVEEALRIIHSEAAREIEVGRRLIFEAALEQADNTSTRIQGVVRHRQAKKASAARKPDLLTQAIEKIARRRPDINVSDLLVALKEISGPSQVIEEVDFETNAIYYRQSAVVRRSYSTTPLKHARFSGLKDRLSRAKRNIRGEKKRSP